MFFYFSVCIVCLGLKVAMEISFSVWFFRFLFSHEIMKMFQTNKTAIQLSDQLNVSNKNWEKEPNNNLIENFIRWKMKWMWTNHIHIEYVLKFINKKSTEKLLLDKHFIHFVLVLSHMEKEDYIIKLHRHFTRHTKLKWNELNCSWVELFFCLKINRLIIIISSLPWPLLLFYYYLLFWHEWWNCR